MSLHISLVAEKVTEIGGLPITNSMLAAVVVTILLALFAQAASAPQKDGLPTTIWQHIGEILINFFEDLTSSIAGAKQGPKFFPLITSIFLFVIFSNWFGLIPGISSIGIYENPEDQALIPPAYALEAGESGILNESLNNQNLEPALREEKTESSETTHEPSSKHAGPKFIPLFRAPTADLNTTLALALVAVVTIQVTGFSTLGAKVHLSKFFNFASPIDFFVGILEFIGELSKILSFSFRLFGNIVAGEILLAVIAYLIPIIAVLPFYGLEIFVGFIQAYVFAILTLIFSSLAMESHVGHESAHH